VSAIFAKLNLKDQRQILVVQSPDSFAGDLAALKGVEVVRDLRKAQEVTFSLAFVMTQAQVDALAPAIARKAQGDALLWFAYPKGSSKKYRSQINRDNGWDVLGREGFEPVRMVAIDEDWSAVRFRRKSYIKVMTRPKSYQLAARAKKRGNKTR
jgi:hypothetical protein